MTGDDGFAVGAWSPALRRCGVSAMNVIGDAAGGSHVGCVRARNEDSFGVLLELEPSDCGCPDRPPPPPVSVRDVVEVAVLTLAVLVMLLDDAVPGGQLDDGAIPPALARILGKLAPMLRIPVLP